MSHPFQGKWITDDEFFALAPRNVFHRQLVKVDLPCNEHRNRHILFRKHFILKHAPATATMLITADDYYKLYINGRFVAQGPTTSYHFHYGYNEVDVTDFLTAGENVIAVHTLYQGLINRVWVSGDQRHGLLCELIADGKVILQSDESFLVQSHTGYTETGTAGYDTQFLERFDSAAPEAAFTDVSFDDSAWSCARVRQYDDYTLVAQETKQLVFETISPKTMKQDGNRIFVDFGSNYVGYLQAEARGLRGTEIIIRCGQELNEDGSVRWNLRANCRYEERWALSGKDDKLDWFDYKSFRYAELMLPEGCALKNVSFLVRHYPFECKARMKPDLEQSEAFRRVWALCVHTQKYGVQEVIQDCMEREKGFYVGDGCYTALTHMMLTGDDSIVRKLIDDAFRSRFITEGMVTCLDCAMMQEIAEYPLMLISLILWHCRLTGDRGYLAQNYPGVCRLLDTYRAQYERDGLLGNLDKWCVVEWPANFRDGYDVDITEGKVCHTPHIALNAYYLEAIHCANEMAALLGETPYRDEEPMRSAMIAAFYDPARHLFTDSAVTEHVSYIGNVLAFAFRLCPGDACREAILRWIAEKGITGVSLFGAVPLLYGLIRCGHRDQAEQMMADEGAWLRMLREDATTTFEGWGKDTKWNTSLFHMTMSDGAIFLMDADLEALFK